jgi:hypothetical protein
MANPQQGQTAADRDHSAAVQANVAVEHGDVDRGTSIIQQRQAEQAAGDVDPR